MRDNRHEMPSLAHKDILTEIDSVLEGYWMGTEYDTARSAFLGQISRVLEEGRVITRRTDATRELSGESFTIKDPAQRCIVSPHRNSNVAASIAESLWTLAGREDLHFIEPYLPRAAKFSDDGLTWRGAYGPRLRHHFGVDQLDEARRLLLYDSHTRRTAMSLFDPGCDYADLDTKDVPCNNWLHFLRVDDRLDLSIAVRSLDLMWGFSGVDSFLWSLVHELMAAWVGLKVGHQHWFVGSCHVYEIHLSRVERILAAATGPNEPTRRIRYSGNWSGLESDLAAFFDVEMALRSGVDVPCREVEGRIPEALICTLTICVAAFWDMRYGRRIDHRLAWLSGTEFVPAIRQLATWSKRTP
ncbi:MAG: thymidylate synthase [Micropruina sp.]|uniref:thymidylate synthase n=1 Tax=Micropruina sp. TaxID=2737536 RepID=UPI0039E40C5C